MQKAFPFFTTVSYDDHFNVGQDVHHQQWGRQYYACRFALGFLQIFGNGEFLTMAKLKSRVQNFGVDFVTIELTAKQEADFEEWVVSATPKLSEYTGELVSSGHKLGVSWDGDNECFIVSVTCKDEAQDNANKCYTSRSDEWVEALLLAIYKWDVISKRSTWAGKAKRSNWG